jgi:hypothetical protein
MEDGFEINNWDDASRWLRERQKEDTQEVDQLKILKKVLTLKKIRCKDTLELMVNKDTSGARLAARESRTTSKPVVRREPKKTQFPNPK